MDVVISPQYQAKIAVYEIASLIGKHEYRSQNQAIYGIMQKDPTFSQTITEIKMETNNTIESDINKILNAESTLLSSKAHELVMVKGFADLNDIAAFKTDQVMSILAKKYTEISIDETLFRRLRANVRQNLAMLRGCQLEEPGLDRLEFEKCKQISDRNSRRYHFRCGHYSIQGSVDGIIRSERCIVEIKNRMFEQEVPMYDMIQCVVYMKLTDLKKCLLVEFFPYGTKRETLYEWNKKQFDMINARLCQVVDSIRSYTRDDVARIIEQNDLDHLTTQIN